MAYYLLEVADEDDAECVLDQKIRWSLTCDPWQTYRVQTLRRVIVSEVDAGFPVTVMQIRDGE